MTIRIDHAAQTRDHLEVAERYASEDWPIQTGEHKVDILAVAQVHATLALVEQQRIANVIALAAQPEQFGPEPAAEARRALIQMVQDPEDGEYTHRVRPAIAAALGIETAS